MYLTTSEKECVTAMLYLSLSLPLPCQSVPSKVPSKGEEGEIHRAYTRIDQANLALSCILLSRAYCHAAQQTISSSIARQMMQDRQGQHKQHQQQQCQKQQAGFITNELMYKAFYDTYRK